MIKRSADDRAPVETSTGATAQSGCAQRQEIYHGDNPTMKLIARGAGARELESGQTIGARTRGLRQADGEQGAEGGAQERTGQIVGARPRHILRYSEISHRFPNAICNKNVSV